MSGATSDNSRGGPPMNCFHYSPHFYIFSSLASPHLFWQTVELNTFLKFLQNCRTVVATLFGKHFKKTIILECPSTHPCQLGPNRVHYGEALLHNVVEWLIVLCTHFMLYCILLEGCFVSVFSAAMYKTGHATYIHSFYCIITCKYCAIH